MTDLQPQPKIITQLFDAVYPSFAMLAGMELDLFTPLKNGPLSVEQLADMLGVQAIKLRPLLYTLVVAKLLTVNDELFSNTPEADTYLVQGKSTYLGGLQGLTMYNWRRILKTAETIRAGGPLEETDYHSTQEAHIALFRGLYPGAILDAQRLIERHDFSTYRTLLDVGGGSGGLAIAMVQANPNLKATIIDLPMITPITQQFVGEAQVAEQVEIQAADAIRDTLSGSYDVVVARHLLQVLSAKDSRALLNNLTTVLKPGGIIHLIGWILDNSRVSPPNTVGYNLVLLNAYRDGQAYTELEYYNWLTETGFEAFERVVFSDGASIITARKPL